MSDRDTGCTIDVHRREATVIDETCTDDCERAPKCTTCAQRKQPRGRSSPMGASYCSWDCPGYTQEPTPGHLWPGELASLRAEPWIVALMQSDGVRADHGPEAAAAEDEELAARVAAALEDIR